MKRIITPLCLLALALLLLPACGSKKSEAAIEREKWLLSLNDSIKLYQQHMEQVQSRLTEMHGKVGELLSDFEYVNNPREVEGYYILNGWKGRYPLDKTGVIARVTEDERFELLATLSGGVFNEIAAMSGNETVSSEVVPHDQALNYRAGNLNKVCFYGNKADSVAGFIASHIDSPVTILYLDKSQSGKLVLPDDQKKMIAATWHLYAAQKEAHTLEKEMPRLAGKISACRRLLEANDSILNSN